MKKIVYIALLIGFVSPQLFAQSNVDALRYSLTDPTGSTARNMSLGGSMGAVGADPSAALSNPAALAQYRTSAFQFSLGMLNIKNTADYLGNSSKSNRYSAEMPSINMVLTERKMNRGAAATSGWVNYNFGIGWNKTADFARRISYSGMNNENSYLDYVSNYVQGLPSSDLDANDEQLERGFYYFENMFWYAYLIDTVSDRNYMPTYNSANPMMGQSGGITTRGGMHELNLSFAANYEHKLYFGFGVDIHQVNYKETNRFTEVDNPNTTGTWNSFDFTRNLNTSGIGYSGRLGLIFRPTNEFRLGLSLHSPTVLSLEDQYSDELYVVYDDGSTEDMQTIDKEFKYNVVTPMKYALQGAYFFGKKGFISAELENLDYSTMGIWADNFEFDGENSTIANKYTSATNIKIGGEYAFNEFRLRAGYSQLGSPFSEGGNFNRKFASLGFGLQENNWGFDIGVVKSLNEDQYVPYTTSGFAPQGVNSTVDGTRIVLSLVTKF
ncbi:MAG: outer membrane protein transport protein [Bacteroidia bacterium]